MKFRQYLNLKSKVKNVIALLLYLIFFFLFLYLLTR